MSLSFISFKNGWKKGFLDGVIALLFPKLCFYCREFHEDRGVFCARCLVGFDLIYPHGRCRYCFEESCFYRCLSCRKRPFPFYRFAALFERKGVAAVLLKNIDQFAKEVAAFFVFQSIRTNWPMPEGFYLPPALFPLCRHVKNFLHIPLVSKRMDYSGKAILYLTENRTREEEIPYFLLGAKLFGLSYHF